MTVGARREKKKMTLVRCGLFACNMAGNLLLACSVSASRGGSASGPAGELWYAGAELCGFTHEQLQANANTNPDIVVSTSLLRARSDVALDANGNVWVVGSGSRRPP